MVEKKFSSGSNKKKLNVEISIPSKKPSNAHQPLKHFATAQIDKKIDLGASLTSATSKALQGKDLLSKMSRSPSVSDEET